MFWAAAAERSSVRTPMNTRWRHCGVSAMLAPSKNVTIYLLTYLLLSLSHSYTQCIIYVFGHDWACGDCWPSANVLCINSRAGRRLPANNAGIEGKSKAWWLIGSDLSKEGRQATVERHWLGKLDWQSRRRPPSNPATGGPRGKGPYCGVKGAWKGQVPLKRGPYW